MRQQSEQHAQALASLVRGFDRQREIDPALTGVGAKPNRSMSLDLTVGAMTAELAHSQRTAAREFQRALDLAETDRSEALRHLERQVGGVEVEFAAGRRRIAHGQFYPSAARDQPEHVGAQRTHRRYSREAQVAQVEADADLRPFLVDGR